MCAMGSCIKVVNKKIGFLLKKKVVSSRHPKPKPPLFCLKLQIFCHGYSHNYKLTPAPSENCFAIFLLRVRSNNFKQVCSLLICLRSFVILINEFYDNGIPVNFLTAVYVLSALTLMPKNQ
jgi:hypothetical protein